MKNKGFTLIELLVVIAIIGILSSVVLASLNSARAKGADAAIKSNLANIRPQAEIYYDEEGRYSLAAVAPGACVTTGNSANSLFADTTVMGQIAAAKAASGSTSLNACSTAITDGGSWAVAQQLKSDSAVAWCVDATGVAKEVALTAPIDQGDLTGAVSATGRCN